MGLLSFIYSVLGYNLCATLFIAYLMFDYVLGALATYLTLQAVFEMGWLGLMVGVAVKVGERVWRVNGRAVGEALDFNGVVGLCRQRPVALDLVDAEA